jgi:hypothetical protein
MRRSAGLVLMAVLVIALSATSKSTASQPEKTLVLRVRASEPLKQVTFSGTIQFDTSTQPLQLTRQATPFGIKIKASSLRASLRKMSGDSGLFVELIEFKDEKEVASMTRTGARVEVDAHPSGDGSSISIR